MASKRRVALLALSMGDPAGIGAEVILKAAAAMAARPRGPELVVIGDLRAMRMAAHALDSVPEPYEWHPGGKLVPLERGIGVFNVGELSPGAMRPGKPSVEGAEAAYRYVVKGARMALEGEADALVTAPISKEWLNRAGHSFPGHSELLAKISGTRLWRMMFAGDQLRLALVTVHLGLAKVPAMLTREGVFQTIRLLAEHLHDHLGIARPRIAVLGFNPHAGENGLFGGEEKRVIAPAIRRAQRIGIEAYGPLAPDSAFVRPPGAGFGFAGAVAMYHDQGLIPIKTVEFERAVNITLGLPFVRTSPDHGTGFAIAGRNRASAGSMSAAIEYAWKASRRRQPAARRAA